MSWIQLELRDGVTAFQPGELVEGKAFWQLDRPPDSIELRLFWYTQGKGDRDVEIMQVIPFSRLNAQDRCSFQLRLPEGPYSFSGKLVSLVWALELVAQPGDQARRVEITVSPTGEEILLRPRA